MEWREDQISSKFREGYDHPKPTGGYKDDGDFPQPHRHLSNWFLIKPGGSSEKLLSSQGGKEKGNGNSHPISLQRRHPLPEDNKFSADYILCGDLIPAPPKSKNEIKLEPASVTLKKLKIWVVDRSATYRGIWVKTGKAWYWLMKPSVDPVPVNVSFRHSDDFRFDEEELSNTVNRPEKILALLPSQEKVHSQLRAKLGLLSNLIDLFSEHCNETSHNYIAIHAKRTSANIHALLSPRENIWMKYNHPDKPLNKEPFDLELLKRCPGFVKQHLHNFHDLIHDNCVFMKSLDDMEAQLKRKRKDKCASAGAGNGGTIIDTDEWDDEDYVSSAQKAEKRGMRYPWGESLPDSEGIVRPNRLIEIEIENVSKQGTTVHAVEISESLGNSSNQNPHIADNSVKEKNIVPQKRGPAFSNNNLLDSDDGASNICSKKLNTSDNLKISVENIASLILGDENNQDLNIITDDSSPAYFTENMSNAIRSLSHLLVPELSQTESKNADYRKFSISDENATSFLEEVILNLDVPSVEFMLLAVESLSKAGPKVKKAMFKNRKGKVLIGGNVIFKKWLCHVIQVMEFKRHRFAKKSLVEGELRSEELVSVAIMNLICNFSVIKDIKQIGILKQKFKVDWFDIVEKTLAFASAHEIKDLVAACKKAKDHLEKIKGGTENPSASHSLVTPKDDKETVTPKIVKREVAKKDTEKEMRHLRMAKMIENAHKKAGLICSTSPSAVKKRPFPISSEGNPTVIDLSQNITHDKPIEIDQEPCDTETREVRGKSTVSYINNNSNALASKSETSLNYSANKPMNTTSSWGAAISRESGANDNNKARSADGWGSSASATSVGWGSSSPNQKSTPSNPSSWGSGGGGWGASSRNGGEGRSSRPSISNKTNETSQIFQKTANNITNSENSIARPSNIVKKTSNGSERNNDDANSSGTFSKPSSTIVKPSGGSAWGSRPVNNSNAWGKKAVNVSNSKNESRSESGGWGSRSNSGSGWGDSNQKDRSSSNSSGWGRAAMTVNSSWKTKTSVQEDVRGRPAARKVENGGRDNDRGGTLNSSPHSKPNNQPIDSTTKLSKTNSAFTGIGNHYSSPAQDREERSSSYNSSSNRSHQGSQSWQTSGRNQCPSESWSARKQGSESDSCINATTNRNEWNREKERKKNSQESDYHRSNSNTSRGRRCDDSSHQSFESDSWRNTKDLSDLMGKNSNGSTETNAQTSDELKIINSEDGEINDVQNSSKGIKRQRDGHIADTRFQKKVRDNDKEEGRDVRGTDSSAPTGGGMGRGRGKTIPAWMTQKGFTLGDRFQKNASPETNVPVDSRQTDSGSSSTEISKTFKSNGMTTMGRGRGRDKTLPAWMTKKNDNIEKLHGSKLIVQESNTLGSRQDHVPSTKSVSSKWKPIQNSNNAGERERPSASKKIECKSLSSSYSQYDRSTPISTQNQRTQREGGISRYDDKSGKVGYIRDSSFSAPRRNYDDDRSESRGRSHNHGHDRDSRGGGIDRGRGSEIESWNQSSSLKDNHDRPAFSSNSGNVGRGRGRGRGKDINLPAWMTQGKM